MVCSLWCKPNPESQSPVYFLAGALDTPNRERLYKLIVPSRVPIVI